MPGFLPDSNCLVAAVAEWHEHHHAAEAEINRRLRRREPMVIAAPSLMEAYSVLTRLPLPYRRPPGDAHRLLVSSFVNLGTVIALDERAYRTVLDRATTQGIAGGWIYDAVIAMCAERAQVDALVTFNERRFSDVVAPHIEIVVPGRARRQEDPRC